MSYFFSKKIFKFLLPLFCLLAVSGCIDLSGSRSNYTKKKVPNTVARAGEVHTMLGGLGLFSKGMNTIRDSVISVYNIPAYGTIWYNAGHVTRFIINNYYSQKNPRPIILVGHSLGANDQIKVARNLNAAGIPVALLVTVDAVSQTIVPPNVKEVLNIYKPGFIPMFSGLKVKAADPSKTLIDNINVNGLEGVKVNHFTIDKNPVVQEMILQRIKKVIAHGKKEHA